MIVFRNYFKIVKKHIKSLLLYSAIFIAILLFSTSSENTEAYQSVKVDIYVKNNSNSKISNALYDYLDKTSNIKKIDEDLVEDSLFYQKISALVIIDKNFKKDRQVKFKQAPRDIYATSVKHNINQFLSQIESYEKSGYSIEDAIKNTNIDLDKKAKVEVITNSKKDMYDGSNFYVNFLSYVLLAQIILIVSTLALVYKNEAIANRNLISPLTKVNQNLQLILAHVVTGLLIWILYMILFYLLYKKSPSQIHIRLMMINSFVFTICTVTMAVFISKIAKSENSMQGIMNVVALGSSFLSGAFVPQEMLGNTALLLAKFLPSYYYIKNNNDIIINPSISTILSNTLIMIAFSFFICNINNTS